MYIYIYIHNTYIYIYMYPGRVSKAPPGGGGPAGGRSPDAGGP